MTGRVLEVRRDAPAESRIVDESISASYGSVVLDVEQFALTANNVTYALFGDTIGYWRFYPTSNDAFGRVPVWGFARVTNSGVSAIKAGSLWYGFLPMASSFRVDVGPVTSATFMAGEAHRRELPAAYNVYRAATPQNGFEQDSRIHDMVFRPLFLTAYLIADVLDLRHPALPALVSSASSKTALGLAAELARRGTRSCIGLTSSANVEFVRSLDVYSDVIAYDDITSVATADSVFVDIAGRDSVRSAVHEHLGDRLKASLAVGAAHGTVPVAPPSNGPAPELFFAPAVYTERTAALGAATFESAYQSGWLAFRQRAHDWLATRELIGLDAAADAWRTLVAGDVPPTEALVVTPSG